VELEDSPFIKMLKNSRERGEQEFLKVTIKTALCNLGVKVKCNELSGGRSAVTTKGRLV
jgi:hypothetical protein